MKQARDPATRDEAQKKIRAAWAPLNVPEFGKETVGRTRFCFDYLAHLKNVDAGRISVIGFCFGGTYAFSLAVNEPKLHSTVAFYGHAPESEEELAKIKCSVLAFYGEQDENLIKDLPALQEKMDRLEKDFESVVYPNCGHAFFNDTNPHTYNKTAAEDAWLKLLDFLNN
jgi:carboxymethylenebutenolidase